MKQIGDMKVNDGGGLWDNEGLVDTLIVDLNRLPKLLMDGQYIAACNTVATMGQRLQNLKEGIKNDSEAKQAQIDELGKLNEEMGQRLFNLEHQGVKEAE